MNTFGKTLALASLTVLTTTSAFAESRAFDLAPFDAIDVSSGISVEVSQGDTQTVDVEARDDSDFEHLELFVEDGVLHAATNFSLLDFIFDGGLLGGAFQNGPPLKVFITIPQLQAIDASSGSEINVDGFSGETLRSNSSSGADIELEGLAYETVALTASSGADIEAQGTCISLTGNVSSGADIEAESLECLSADVTASSGGSLSAHASESVDANASSGGGITIVGTPDKTNVNSSSGGDVHIKS